MNVSKKINVNAIKARISKVQMNILRQESALDSSKAELEYWTDALNYANAPEDQQQKLSLERGSPKK